MRNIIYLLSLAIIFGCQNKNTEINIDHEIIDSIQINNEYFENGNISLIKEYNLSTGITEYAKYYESGELERTGAAKDSIRIGEWHNYSKKGELTLWQQYVNYKNSKYLNQIIYYNEDGSVNESNSSYYDIKSNMDTVLLGDTLVMNFRLGNSVYKKGLMILLGELNTDNTWKNESTIDTLLNNDYYFDLNLNLVAKDLGDNLIQGQIIDYTSYIEDDKLIYEQRVMFFSEEYFVE
tara:strand:- start:6 stop:713 length:708 start_codon:yes stop_codon:yes gene_type:complete